MGRLTNENPAAAAAAPPSSPVKHFTHPHDLHPVLHYSPQTLCSACNLQCSGIMYTCKLCNFCLHESCANLQQNITHRSHGGCTLTLLTAVSYPGGLFSCDACSRLSGGWSYHCDRCEYDLHVTCASKPLKMIHPVHRSCDLQLTFKNPYENSNGFLCDICHKIGSRQWLYHCKSCEFDVHLDCTTVGQPMLQLHRFLMMGSNACPQVLLQNDGTALEKNLIMSLAVTMGPDAAGQAVLQELLGDSSGDRTGGSDAITDGGGGDRCIFKLM